MLQRIALSVVSSGVGFQVLAGSIGGLKLVRALIRTPGGETTRGRSLRDPPTPTDRDLNPNSGDYRLFRPNYAARTSRS